MQDRIHTSERIATHLSQRENLEPVPSRSKKHKLSSLDVKATLQSSLPGDVIAGRRKRCLSPCAASQVERTVSTSIPVTEPVLPVDERRPPKRHKRSLSTPPAPKSSQLSTHLRSRRRCRSRAGSPATDVEHIRPTRFSARLAKKTRSFISSQTSDIYTHLAGPDGIRKLLSDPTPGSVVSSVQDKVASSQSDKKHRGRRRKTADLTNESAKKDLMEEWAQMRQSQGALPLSGIDENACFGQLLLRCTGKSDESVSLMQLEVATRVNSPEAEPVVVTEQTTIIGTPRSQETIIDASPKAASLAPVDFENTLTTCVGVSGKMMDHTSPMPSSDGRVEELIVPNVDAAKVPSSIIGPHPDKDAPSGVPVGVPETMDHIDLLQRDGSPTSTFSALPLRRGSAQVTYTRSTKASINEVADAVNVNNPSGDSTTVISHTRPFDRSVYLDSHQEFYMLDIPEILTLPWEAVASQFYVPPGLGKLISGMREQLKMEARTRQRAEELYQAELNRRICAEKVIQGLRTELEKVQADLESK